MAKRKWTCLLISIASVLILTSCANQKDAVKGSPDQPEAFQMPERIVKYTRGSCFGKCPVFELQIFDDGKAILDAKMHMDHKGLFDYTLTREELTELYALLSATDFHSMKDTYYGEVADLPAVGLSVQVGTFKKSINGNWQFPEELLHIFRYLDKYVHSEKWMPAQDDNSLYMQSESIIPDRVIVDLHKQIKPETWIKEYDNYRGEIKKKIAPRLSLYLVSFDPDLVHPADFIQMLLSDPAVNNAEFDKKLKMRN